MYYTIFIPVATFSYIFVVVVNSAIFSNISVRLDIFNGLFSTRIAHWQSRLEVSTKKAILKIG